MKKLITEILSPPSLLDPTKIEQIIGYYQNGAIKTPAISSVYAIKQQVYGLEVVVGAPISTWKKHGNVTYKLQEYTVYLTQHEGKESTIDMAEYLIMNYVEFFNVSSYYPPTPTTEANILRAVVEFSFRKLSCNTGETEYQCC